MTISSIAIATSGMQRASDRFEASAGRIARTGTGLGEVDMATELVNVLQAKAEFTASASIVRVASDMSRSAIDILA